MEPTQGIFLSQIEKEKLFSFINNPQITLAELEQKVKENFTKESYDSLSNELNALCREMIVSAEGIQFVSSLFLIYVMMNAGNMVAKCAMYGMLRELERTLKKEIIEAREKEKMFISQGGEQPKKSIEATQTEIFRIHSCAKVFAFQLLSGSVLLNQTVSQIVSQKQEVIDLEIDKFEQSGSLIQEAISDAFMSWKSDRKANSVSTLLESCTLAGSSVSNLASVLLPSVKVKLPSAPVLSGELHFFLPESTCLSFDSKA